VLGLPDGIKACLFDLDGVLTQTAVVHAKAWKEMFDAFLETQDGQQPFDEHADYDEYVDGKPREDGVRDFLTSRGIDADDHLVDELATKKNDIVQQVIERDGVEPYEGSVRYLEAARDAGLRRAVVSSSHNCEQVLKAAGIDHLLEARVDGDTAVEQALKGKPAPDMFLAGAKALGVEPAQAAVFEDALVGVEAGRAGAFGHVVGLDRVGQRDALAEHGADLVLDDLAELL
jgi:beta-phosphoglucomutase family hydrolase